MSREAVTAAYEQNVFPSSKRFVLVTLADWCSADGLVYQATDTIAQRTALDAKTVARQLDALEADGILKDTEKRAGATGKIKVYKLCFIEGTLHEKKPPHHARIKEVSNPPITPGLPSEVIPPQSPRNPPIIQTLEKSPYTKEPDLEPGSTPIPPRGKVRKPPKPILPQAMELAEKMKRIHLEDRGTVLVCPESALRDLSGLFERGEATQEEACHVANLVWKQPKDRAHFWCGQAGDMAHFVKNYGMIREQLNGQLQSAMAGSVGVMKDPSGQRDEVIHAKILKI